MMKFSEIPYEQPNLESLSKEFEKLLQQFEAATTFEEQNKILETINKIRSDFETQSALVYIRHTINTTDPFYDEQQKYFDKNTPIFVGLVNKLYEVLTRSKFRSELEKIWGKQLFSIADTTLKTFQPEIIEDLQKENELSSQYTKLIAGAIIPFEGTELNLAGLIPFEQSTDREVRKRAAAARYQFMAANAEKLDSIYDQLVKIRTTIARKLGYKNFVGLAYDRMNRTDYNADMVTYYRSMILEHVVPLATYLRAKQAARLKLDKLKFYDEPLLFPTGNAKPKGPAEWILNNGKKMYEELSAETSEFFNFMTENELLDLENKKGKAGGGYCSFLSKYKAPFIFSNFNGTSGDIDVLTHEAGHAFQGYSSRNFEIPEYQWPTMEACEIHSMSMEFFTWPWMKLFFQDEADKYKYAHLAGAILFLPYGATVDEFQHWVYENPNATPKERNAQWRALEKKYLPHRDYDGNAYLESGAFWQKQAHIYNNPFYYIDYTLALVCALQFWIRTQKNDPNAWNDYLALCKAGGSKSFLELVKLANLKSPFEKGTVEQVVHEARIWLESIDDSKL
jgi:M3 family oligoendopeptidase